MEDYLAIQRKELLIHMTLMNLQEMALSEKKSDPKRLHTILFHLYNFLK